MTFQNFVNSHNRWRTYGEKIAKAQKEFSKELRRDPWSAQDIKRQIDADHASAHFENRCVEGSQFSFNASGQDVGQHPPQNGGLIPPPPAWPVGIYRPATPSAPKSVPAKRERC